MNQSNELRTEADEREPLGAKEATAMGRQDARPTSAAGAVPVDVAVYGDVENGPETQDQYDAHHAEPDEHL